MKNILPHRIARRFAGFCRTLPLLLIAAVAPARAADMSFTAAQVNGLNGVIDFSQPTIAGMPNNLGPGDTVFIAAHSRKSLKIQNLRQGSAANPITVTNSEGQLQIGTTNLADTTATGLSLSGCRYVRLAGTPSPGNYNYGIKIDGTYRNAPPGIGGSVTGLKISNNGSNQASNIEVTNLEICNTGFAGIQAKNESGTALWDGLHIHGNYIHDTYGEGMYIGWTSPGHHSMSNVEINDNEVVNAGWDGIQVNWVVSNLHVHGNTIIGYALHSAEAAEIGEPHTNQNKGLTIGTSGGTVRGNWVEATGDLAGQPMFWKLYNSVKIYNNVLIHAGESGDGTNGSSGIYITGTANSGQTFKFMANTIVHPEGVGIHSNTAGLTYTNNIIAAPRLNPNDFTNGNVNNQASLHTNTLAGAGFVDAGNHNYRLTSGSAARNLGANLVAEGVTIDFEGTARPATGNFDAGAFQFASDTQAPTIPAGLAAGSIGQTSFTLTWSASSDNVGVTGYEVFRNGSPVGTPAGTSFNVTNLTAATTYSMTVRARDAAGNWSAQSAVLPVTTASGGGPNGTGLRGRYYDNKDLTSFVGERVDAGINFAWGSGKAHASMTDSDNFSVRWEGEVQPQHSETYTFYAKTNDGNRLWVNGVQLTNRWVDGNLENSGTIALTAGQKYTIKLEFYEGINTAGAELRWSSASQAKQLIPAVRLYPATTP